MKREGEVGKCGGLDELARNRRRERVRKRRNKSGRKVESEEVD
jgi:hypothetical protein